MFNVFVLGHFGSVVSSYFTFLRWIVYVNLIITLIIISFVVIPEVLFRLFFFTVTGEIIPRFNLQVSKLIILETSQTETLLKCY